MNLLIHVGIVCSHNIQQSHSQSFDFKRTTVISNVHESVELGKSLVVGSICFKILKNIQNLKLYFNLVCKTTINNKMDVDAEK